MDDYEHFEDTSFLEIEDELDNDLKLLMKEAMGNKKDERSQRIVNRFDRQLREWISEATNNGEGDYRFTYNLADI